MKRTLFFITLLVLTLSCTSKTEAPRLDLTLTPPLKENVAIKEFITETQANVNELAVQCVTMNKKAEAFRQVAFDSLSAAKQTKLVQLDHDYVQMWYEHNVFLTAQSVKMMGFLQDAKISLDATVELSKAMTAITLFVQDLKNKYGEDLKLDPYAPETLPVQPAETVQDTVQTTTL